MINIRLVQMDLAEEVGIGESMVVCQLHYWSSKPKIGMVVDGVKYVKNTYEEWIAKENFPCFSLSTIKRIFKKLIDRGIVLVQKFKKKNWDHTNYFALNYSHPSLTPLIGSDRNECKGQLDTPDSVNLTLPYNTDTTPEKTAEKTYRKPPVSFSSKPTSTTRPTVLASEGLDRRTNPCVASLEEQYKEASKWLEEQSEDFRKQAREYYEYYCNGPTVRYPVAYKKKIIVEIWKKQNGLDNCTTFEYINKEVLRHVEAVEIECRREEKVDGFEEEMMRLYQTGELYEPTIE